MEGLPNWGEDYDLERWTTGEKDYLGNLEWHYGFPGNDDWKNITIVTLNLDPHSLDGDYRNVVIDPDKPLDPWGFRDPNDPYWFDLDDLAGEILDRYDIAY